MSDRVRVGVLALQGNVVEHMDSLFSAGARGVPVKLGDHLDDIVGLIIPGGESTTVMMLLDRFGLVEPIRARARQGMPVWGTCMGLVLSAHDVVGKPEQPTLQLLDVSVRRNASGRQIVSAERDLSIPVLGAVPFRSIFIRAPRIERCGPSVQVLASMDGHPIFVRQGNIMGTSFHPELTADQRVHQYFLGMVTESIGKQTAPA